MPKTSEKKLKALIQNLSLNSLEEEVRRRLAQRENEEKKVENVPMVKTATVDKLAKADQKRRERIANQKKLQELMERSFTDDIEAELIRKGADPGLIVTSKPNFWQIQLDDPSDDRILAKFTWKGFPARKVGLNWQIDKKVLDIFDGNLDSKGKGAKYTLNKFNIHAQTKYTSTIFKDIRRAYEDVKRWSQAGFRPYKAVLNISAEVLTLDEDGEEKRLEHVTLSFKELDYPNVNFEDLTKSISKEIDRYTASDKWLDVQSVVLHFIPTPLGGCYTEENFKHDFKKLNLQGVVLKNPKSSDNNCFFHALKPEFKEVGIKLTKNSIRKIRSEFGLTVDCMVNIEVGGRIASKYLQKRVGICNQDKEYFGQTGDVNLMIIGNHYLRLECVQRICEYCGKLINKVHDPTVCIHRRLLAKVLANKEKFVFPAKINAEKSKDLHLLVFHYDIETYRINKHGQSIPNCVGYTWRSKEGERIYEYQTGPECMEKMLERLITLHHIKYVNAFNGGSFDHYYLIQAARTFQSLAEIAPVKGASGIVTAEFCGKKLIDIRKHLGSSLQKCLKSFKCEAQKGEFDHTLNKAWDELSPEIQSDLLTYLKADVMGLAELSDKFHHACMQNYGCSWIEFISTSQMTYGVWTNWIKDEYLAEGKIQIPNEPQWAFIQKSIYGGRTQLHRKNFTSESYTDAMAEIKEGRMTAESFNRIQDYLIDADVVSLYPTAMLEQFPLGSTRRVEEWEEGKLGIYYVHYTPNKKILTPVLPTHREGKTCWDLLPGEGVYTSVDLETARSFGYTFTVKNGIVWEEKGFVFKNYIEEMFTRKESAVKDSPAYTLAKLFMNGLYGKTIQRPRYEKTFFIKEGSDWNKILPKYYITSIDSASFDDIWIVTGEIKDPVKRAEAITKPSQLGAFVLAYSRRIMLEKIKAMNPHEEISKQFYYTDTDSLQVHQSILKEAGIPINGKKLGELSNDLLKDGMLEVKIIRGVWVAPKMYTLQYIAKMEDGTFALKEHRVGKGVKKINNVIPFTLENYEHMSWGGTIEITNKDIFKRFDYKLNNKEKERGTNFFSIAIRDMPKELNKTPWCGRDFIGNDSVPIGYEIE